MIRTPYIDLYRNLNRHLHKTKDGYEIPGNCIVMSDTRNGPVIYNDEDILRAKLDNVFGFTDNLFSTHSYHYPKQTYVIHKPTIFSIQVLADVNYRWCTEYYHFLTEVLPNTLFLYAREPVSVVMCTKSKFTEEMFRWFGINVPIVERNYPIMSRALVPFVECGNPSREKIEILRSVVESKLTFECTIGILIHRHKNRVVSNEDELFEECKQKFPHLNWVIFDVLSPNDTALLFSKAAVIVAPHGAGLTNMIFSKRGISIYEFMPLDEPNICYWHLSEMLGNNYTMIPTPWSDPDTKSMMCTFSR